MSTPNIERFDQACGLIFAHLFESFPQRIGFGSDVLEPIFKDSSSESDDWLSRYVSKEGFFNSTMNWLIDAGYIWCAEGQNNHIQTFYTQCVLTAKALEALKATPDSLTGSSLGQSLGEAAKSGALDAAKDLANQVISKGVGIATSAAMAVLGP
ncbi:hypothetical protein [Pseudomonas sp. ZS001]|uniref:hypothetical protein n=1 Tax=Pseudomonas sp. ZS001 TaxID=3138070 RepID=UPI003139551C